MTSGQHQQKQMERPPTPTPRRVEGGSPPEPVGSVSGLTKLLFAFTKRHRGKAIELDANQDTMRVLGPRGEELAVVNSDVALDHLLGCAPTTTTPAQPEEARPLEDVPPRPKPFHVSARGNDGREYEGLCPLLGRNGIFLELTRAPAPGTQLDMAIVRSDGALGILRSRGTVTWACQQSDEFGFGPGVGVTCTWHSPDLAAFLSDADAPSSR